MPYSRSILVSAFLAVLLIGCKKAETPPVPKVDSGGSVATPAASMPPSEASTPPAAAGAVSGSGDAAGATQATPKELSKAEESAAMPMSGQANNHSTAPSVTDKK
ncbi:hypothetical protein D3C72_217120 [compost metagenome]